jgi:hypothetical protein
MTARAQRLSHAARDSDTRLGQRDPMSDRLGADADHGRAPPLVDMAEAAARHQPPM